MSYYSRWNYVEMLSLKCEFCEKPFLQSKAQGWDGFILIGCPFCNRYVSIKWHRFVAGRKWKLTMKL